MGSKQTTTRHTGRILVFMEADEDSSMIRERTELTKHKYSKKVKKYAIEYDLTPVAREIDTANA
tara:strand:- start:272 stop:463 length:192 start_codon:yes stop_codon:yes gene_type:complete